MSDLYRVTYMGEGVRSTAVGAFAKNVTAFVEEDFARSLAGQDGWVIADPQGKELTGSAAGKAEKAEKKSAEAEKKPEAEKAAEKKPEAEKAAEKKPEAEKVAEKKPAEVEKKK